ncbi:MAG: co-chaperone GroES [Microthrixaceae bacterium]|nr:co-chaperone GroES [Microthrixaceae bacterium]HMT26451.1 co-chaperone GroES [Microthrixaceae bacterium]HMT61853.1 co-chaperone GroES [Microthrixaceae bacterium]
MNDVTSDSTDDHATGTAAFAPPAVGDRPMGRHDRLPIKMLQDRIMVQLDAADGERRSTGGILIPATAQLGRRLSWAEVKAAGPAVRHVEVGDQVLFDPSDLSEVEVGGELFIILRERDLHAVAAQRLELGSTGLYL